MDEFREKQIKKNQDRAEQAKQNKRMVSKYLTEKPKVQQTKDKDSDDELPIESMLLHGDIGGSHRGSQKKKEVSEKEKLALQ